MQLEAADAVNGAIDELCDVAWELRGNDSATTGIRAIVNAALNQIHDAIRDLPENASSSEYAILYSAARCLMDAHTLLGPQVEWARRDPFS